MANEFGGPSPQQSFLVGLATSTMDAFKQDHDNNLKEDWQKKNIDYDLLMKAMKTVQEDDTLTPSQRSAATQEIMNRSIDIFKPKGHGGIKDHLKDLFGGGERYQPQGVGNVLTQAHQRPIANVHAVVPGGTEPVTSSGVTLPPPPSMPYTHPELTYHEQELQDKERLIDAQTTRQLTVQAQKLKAIREQNDQKNLDMMHRIGLRDELKTTQKLREYANMRPGGADDPNNMDWAREQLQAEIQQKRDVSKSRIALQQERIKGIENTIATSKQKIDIANRSLSLRTQRSWNDDPQVKGAWKKVDEYKSEAQRLRTSAAIAHGKYMKDGDEASLTQAEDFERQAEASETQMQGVINNIETRHGQLQGRVSLPSPPTGRPQGATLQGAIDAFKTRAHRDPTPDEIANIKKYYGFQ